MIVFGLAYMGILWIALTRHGAQETAARQH
jgi:hypothetical protein